MGKCALDTKQKCKACWLCACINIYHLDDKKKDVISRYPPRNLSDLNNNQILDVDQEMHQEEDDDLRVSSPYDDILSQESDYESSSEDRALDFSSKKIGSELDKDSNMQNGDVNNNLINNENNAPTNEFNTNGLINNQMNPINGQRINELLKENDKPNQLNKSKNNESINNDLLNFITTQNTASINTTTMANSNVNFNSNSILENLSANNSALMNSTNLGLYSNNLTTLAQRQFNLDWNNNISAFSNFENGGITNLNYQHLNFPHIPNVNGNSTPKKAEKRQKSNCNNCEACTQPDCDQCKSCINRINNVPNRKKRCIKKKCLNRKLN